MKQISQEHKEKGRDIRLKVAREKGQDRKAGAKQSAESRNIKAGEKTGGDKIDRDNSHDPEGDI